MKHLVPCPECNRHVRASEPECPFCALPIDLPNTPPPQLPRGRLSRAATLAFGATLVSATALSACGGDAEESVPSDAGGAGVASLGGGQTIYGAPSEPVGGAFGNGGSPNIGEGGAFPVYGGPPGEAGMGGAVDLPGAGGTSDDAGAGGEPTANGGKGGSGGHGGGSAPIYGAPPAF